MASLPGINDTSQAEISIEGDNEAHKLSISQGSNWKVDVSADARLTIQIISGIAEIFGTELANGREYTFRNYKFSLFAVEDVVLEWRCPELNSNNLFISVDTTATYVYNLHFALEKMRSSSFDGPKVLVVGASCSGKTSLCRTLCAYGMKFKPYQPMYVNLDPHQAIFTPPGCLAAIPISDILDVQSSRWGESMTSGATQLHSKQPLVKNYGLEKISENRSLYLDTIAALALDVGERLQNDSQVRRSGYIIDTPSISQLDENFDELETIAKLFKINVVVVLDNEEDSVFEKIASKLSPYVGTHVIRLPKLSAASDPGDVYKRTLQRTAIREYFYGTHETVLSPYVVGADFEDVTVWKPKNILQNPDLESDSSVNEFSPVDISASNLQHALVAITYADRKATSSEIQRAPLLGFALITEVNEKRRKLRILLPVPGRLPNKSMVLTSYGYLE